MAALATQHPVNSGALTLSAAATGDTVNLGNGTDTVLVVQNTDTNPHTLTVPVNGATDYGVDLGDYTLTVPAAGVRVVPLRRDFDNGAGTNSATLNWDTVTGVKVAVLRVP